MRLPIDTTAMTFLCANVPEPVVEFESKRPRTDETGAPLYAMQVVALADGGAEVISVKTAGEPTGIVQGRHVRVTGLVATPWAMGERSGISFKGARIELDGTATSGGGPSASGSARNAG